MFRIGDIVKFYNKNNEIIKGEVKERILVESKYTSDFYQYKVYYLYNSISKFNYFYDQELTLDIKHQRKIKLQKININV